MIRLVTLFFFCAISTALLSNKPKITVNEYIESWKDVAIQQMNSHQIPASIILAQGILESGFGNSMLATRANNHFGIKCHDWKGKKFYQDDDAKDECFRKYKNAAESFEDHSEFLTSRSRYASLFDLDITDYKKWAKGLRDAGYATNPKYANRLISIIEKYDLYQFDQFYGDFIVSNKKTPPSIGKDTPLADKGKQNTVQTAKTNRKVYVNQNRTKYVIAGKHDTFYQIAKEMGLNLKQLNKWNNFHPKKDVLVAGDKVYIMKKRGKSNIEEIRVQKNQDLWQISQEYGIQLKSLLEKNNFSSPEVALNEGDLIRLR